MTLFGYCFLSDPLHRLNFLFPEQVLNPVTACSKSQFHFILDLLTFVQRLTVDRNPAYLRVGKYDQRRCTERDSNFDGEMPCFVKPPATFIKASRRAVTRPCPLKGFVWFKSNPGMTEPSNAVFA